MKVVIKNVSVLNFEVIAEFLVNFLTTGSVWQLRGRACEGGHMLAVGAHQQSTQQSVWQPLHPLPPCVNINTAFTAGCPPCHFNHPPVCCSPCSPRRVPQGLPPTCSPRCRGEDVLSLQQHLSPCPSLLQICALVPIIPMWLVSSRCCAHQCMRQNTYVA